SLGRQAHRHAAALPAHRHRSGPRARPRAAAHPARAQGGRRVRVAASGDARARLPGARPGARDAVLGARPRGGRARHADLAGERGSPLPARDAAVRDRPHQVRGARNDMRVESDPPDEQRGPLSELLRLQSEFQARLADETLRYLRRLQGAFAPAAPGTVVRPDGDGELRAAGRPGQRVTLRLEAENRQRVHCLVTPMLTPLVARTGTTWFPAADPSPAATLLAPGEVGGVTVELVLPVALPDDA